MQDPPAHHEEATIGARKSKLWDDYVEKRVRETQRREFASDVILDYYGARPPVGDPEDLEGIYVIQELAAEGLTIGLQQDEEAWIARVQIPPFLRRLLREGDTFFFKLRREDDGYRAVWIGSPWLH